MLQIKVRLDSEEGRTGGHGEVRLDQGREE